MRTTCWEACLPVHTFDLTALKIAIIMDIFTEVKIHGHDNPVALVYLPRVFKAWKGEQRSELWVNIKHFSHRLKHLSDVTKAKVSPQLINSKKWFLPTCHVTILACARNHDLIFQIHTSYYHSHIVCWSFTTFSMLLFIFIVILIN